MAQNGNQQLVGIDFGASNLKAVKLAGRKARPLKLNKDDMGGNELPNFLYYNQLKDGSVECWVGKRARDKMATMDAENGIGGLKRKLELESWQQYIPHLGREVKAIEAISHTLEVLKKGILKGQDADVKAVMTAPVCYTAQQMGSLAKAAEMAGLDVAAFVTESFAAMFALKNLGGYADGLTVIFDLGGSTLDVSVVQVLQDGGRLKIIELVTGGLKLGGQDVDAGIYEDILLPRYGEELRKHWPGEPETTRQRILIETAHQKESMYLDGEESVLMMIEPDIELRREDVESIIHAPGFSGRIIGLLNGLFDKLEENPAGYGLQDVRHVVALGGCMRIPAIGKLLEDYFGKEVFDAEEFDYEDTSDFLDGLDSRYEAVAAGAARYLEILLAGTGGTEVFRAAPFDYGYLSEGKFECCIAGNMPHTFTGGYQILNREEMDENGWRLAVHQAYPDAENPEPVFVGSVQLDEELYASGPVLFRMGIDSAGGVKLEFFQESGGDSDEPLRLVEEHVIPLGGSDDAR